MKLFAKFLLFLFSIVTLCCSSNESRVENDQYDFETVEISKIYAPSKNFDGHENTNLSPKRLQSYSRENYLYKLIGIDSTELARTTINLTLDYNKEKIDVLNINLKNSESLYNWSLKIREIITDNYTCKNLRIQSVILILEGIQKYTEVERKMQYDKNKDLINVIEKTSNPKIGISQMLKWEFISPLKDVIVTNYELDQNNRIDIIERKYKLNKGDLYRVTQDIKNKFLSGIKGGLVEIGEEKDVFIIRQNNLKIDSVIFKSNNMKRPGDNFCMEDINLK